MSETKKYLVLVEGDSYCVSIIDENLTSLIAEEEVEVYDYRHESFWVAYVDENGNICWEEVQ